jgi:TBC1 domain family member 8/9
MVILADELLEQFFESFFPQSFHLSSVPNSNATTSPASTLSGNLTTFTNLGTPVKNLISSSSADKEGFVNVGRAGGVVEPGSRGLRGVLDNIVNDGMRMAAEMRKRMDEAQKEYDRNNLGVRRDEEDEDEEFDEKAAAKRDQDLLEGAEVASIKTVRSDIATLQSDMSRETKVGSEDAEPSLLDTKSVEFES